MTPAPAATTTPANSCPRTRGARAPVSGCGTSAGMNTGPLSHSSRSVPQIPHHLTRSCSSPGPGGAGGGTSSTRTSPRACHRTASISVTLLQPRKTGNLHDDAQLTQARRRRKNAPSPARRMKPGGGTMAVPVSSITPTPQSPTGKDGQDPIITDITTLKQSRAVLCAEREPPSSRWARSACRSGALRRGRRRGPA